MPPHNLRYVDHSNILLGIVKSRSSDITKSTLKAAFLEARSSPSLTFELLLRVFLNEKKLTCDDSIEYIDILTFLILTESNTIERKRLCHYFIKILSDINANDEVIHFISSYESRYINDVLQDGIYHTLVAQIYLNIGSLIDAKKRFLMALPYSRNNIHFFLGLSRCFLSMNDHQNALRIARICCFLEIESNVETRDRIFQSLIHHLTSATSSSGIEELESLETSFLSLHFLKSLASGSSKHSHDFFQIIYHILYRYSGIEPETLTLFGTTNSPISLSARIASSIDVSYLSNELLLACKENRDHFMRNGKPFLPIDWNMTVPANCMLELAFCICITKLIE